MSKLTRRLLNWAGSGLAVLGVLFVLGRLKNYGNGIDLSILDLPHCSTIAGLALVYGAANLLLALAWLRLLGHLGCAVSARLAIRTYGVSQLAKYVPGNIFHLAGRQAIGMAAGMPAAVLVKSMLWELLLLALGGSLFAVLVLPELFPVLPTYSGPALWLVVVAFATLLVRHFISSDAGHALRLQVLFLVVSAAVFVSLFELVKSPSDAAGVPLSLIGGVYVLAWLAGLVTPGAPAGVGVRELVLLLFLKGALSEADLLLTALLGRVVTVIGDLAYFLAAMLMTRPANYQEIQ